MTRRDWRAEIDAAPAYVLILDRGFEGSVGEEQMEYAIAKRKPVVVVQIRGSRIPVPPQFEEYSGPKRLVMLNPPSNRRDLAPLTAAVRELSGQPILGVAGWAWEEEDGGGR